VYKFLLAQTHDPDLSEDLTEDTFLAAIKSIKRYDGSCKLSVWLCQIAKHLWYKEIERRKKRGIAVEMPEILAASEISAAPENTPDSVLCSEKSDLYRAIHKLPESSREIVLLRLSGEFSFSEIGEIIGKSESFARTAFYRAKEEIRRIINAQS
jgi:RNA polymerase sigma-70 factor (ECF subfamily)